MEGQEDFLLFFLFEKNQEKLKFKERELKLKDKEYLEFAINRKNRKMIVQTLPTSFYAFRDIKILRPDHKENDYLFAPQYEDRRTAMRYMSMPSSAQIFIKFSSRFLAVTKLIYFLRSHTSPK